MWLRTTGNGDLRLDCVNTSAVVDEGYRQRGQRSTPALALEYLRTRGGSSVVRPARSPWSAPRGAPTEEQVSEPVRPVLWDAPAPAAPRPRLAQPPQMDLFGASVPPVTRRRGQAAHNPSLRRRALLDLPRMALLIAHQFAGDLSLFRPSPGCGSTGRRSDGAPATRSGCRSSLLLRAIPCRERRGACWAPRKSA